MLRVTPIPRESQGLCRNALSHHRNYFKGKRSPRVLEEFTGVGVGGEVKDLGASGDVSHARCRRHPRKMEPGVPERSESVSRSEHCEEAYGVLLTLREADSGAREEAPMNDLEVAEKEAQRLLAQEEAAMDGGTPQNPQPRYPWEGQRVGF